LFSLHDRQVSVQALPQQTPSEQWPELHSVPAMHPSPLAFLPPQASFEQVAGATQSFAFTHFIRQPCEVQM
jgi:hypothetical protein